MPIPIDRAIMRPHVRYPGGCSWALTPAGISIDGAAPVGSGGRPETVTRIWRQFRAPLLDAAARHGVPLELIIATIATETRGSPAAVRQEPGYVSDQVTPDRVSPGLMQTLISTARQALGRPDIDRAWLLDPANSIHAGTAYIAGQRAVTGFDPPLVAAAYNAGGIYRQDGPGNRWRLRQYPIGTGEHVDRFVRWLNDCFVLFAEEPAEVSTLCGVTRVAA